MAEHLDEPYRPMDGERGWPVEEGSYVGRHWTGDLSLGVSFWVNSFLLGIAFGVIVFIVVYAVASGGNRGAIMLVLIALIPISITLSVWQLVGIWRSAENHKYHTGRKGWAVVAQVLVVLGWLGLVLNTVDTISLIAKL